MDAKTQALFLTLRMAKERWSKDAGHRDAYRRGSRTRKYIADQFIRYRRLVGAPAVIMKLRLDLAKGAVTTF